MRHDYSDGLRLGQGRAAARFAIAVVATVALSLVVACGGEPKPSSSPSSIDEAFRSAHPKVTRPDALATARADLSALQRTLTAHLPAGVPVLVPAGLPAGWGVAAPYVAVGNGAALPNPQLWERGYRLTFTDGRALLIIEVGAERVPGVGEWAATQLTLRGRPLRRRPDGRRIVFATPAAPDWRVVVVGDGLTGVRAESLMRVLLPGVSAMLESP